MPIFSSTIQLYMKYCYNLAPKTSKIYKEHLDRLLIKLGDVPIDQISYWQLVDYMAGLCRRNGVGTYSPGYQHQIWRSLHTFFEFCIREEWIDKNPMKGVPKPRLEIGPKPRLTLEQISQLTHATKLTTLSSRNLAIVLLMVDSGLRKHEVVNLRAVDIHLDEGTIYVRANKTRKTREVPIRLETIGAIEKYLEQRPLCESQTETLFLTRDNNDITGGAIHLLMKRLQKRLGFPLYAHLLRHSFANHYNRKGNLRKLQKILGHSSVSTTAAYYTDPDMEDIIEEHKIASPLAQIKNRENQ